MAESREVWDVKPCHDNAPSPFSCSNPSVPPRPKSNHQLPSLPRVTASSTQTRSSLAWRYLLLRHSQCQHGAPWEVQSLAFHLGFDFCNSLRKLLLEVKGLQPLLIMVYPGKRQRCSLSLACSRQSSVASLLTAYKACLKHSH